MDIVKSRCNMCHPRCGINAFVQDGRIVGVDGMPEHPFSFMCAKGRAIPELVNAPDRITGPLRKVNGEFQEVSWDEALGFVADRLTAIKAEHGAKSIVFHTGMAYVGTFVAGIIRRLSDAIGAPNYTSGGSFCWLARTMGYSMTLGEHVAPDFNSATRCAVIWGHNPSASNPELANRVHAVKSRWGKVIVVDPRAIPLAKIADIHAPVRPGTDCALALGMLNVIISENLYDRGFVERWTTGFDKLAEHVKDYPPERVAAITWVPAEMIREMARMYAGNRPAGISAGISMDQSTNGIQAIRAIAILMAVTGNVDVSGGNIIPPPRMAWPVFGLEENITKDTPVGTAYPLFTRYCRAEQQTTALLDTMLTDKPYPIKALLSFGCNLMLTWPDTNRVRKALEKLDLFVNCEIFMTDTARAADVVLPGVTFMERADLRDYRNMGLPLFFMANPAGTPPGNRMEDWKIAAGIGRKMGYGKHFPWETTEELFNFLLKPSGLSVEQMKKRPGGVYYGEKIPQRYVQEGFRTPSKKVELYSSILAEAGYEPLPVYHELPESPASTPGLAREYPLVLVTGVKTMAYTHSQYRNLPSMRKRVPEPYVEIHPQAATSNGIADGDTVRVETVRGSIELKAKVTPDIVPGAVAVQHGWSEANANLLTTMEAGNRDPISGYPGLRQLLCRVVKVRKGK